MSPPLKSYRAAKVTASLLAASATAYAFGSNRSIFGDESHSYASGHKLNSASSSTTQSSLSRPNQKQAALFYHRSQGNDDQPLFPFTPEQPLDKVKLLQDRFRVGDYYIWLYRDANGSPTSWEKYSITRSTEDGIISIEMSTKFAEDDEYFTHHRMTVDLKSHLESQSSRENWRLALFEYRKQDDDGSFTWKSNGTGENVQAFEEKFDIFSMLNMTNKYESKTLIVGFQSKLRPLTLLQSNRHNYTDSWYAPPPNGSRKYSRDNLSGVALLKYFEEHSFKLVQKGHCYEENSDTLFTIHDDKFV